MQLTRAGEYAIRGLVGLAAHADEKRTILVSRVAEEQDVSPAFLAKIFQQLVKAGLMNSSRGARGGFNLARSPANITIREIVEAIEGPTALNRCLLHDDPCERAGSCPMAEVWRDAQNRMLDVLEQTTVADIVAKLNHEHLRKLIPTVETPQQEES